MRIALTGAPMAARIAGRIDALAWNAVHVIRPGRAARRSGARGRASTAICILGGGIATERGDGKPLRAFGRARRGAARGGRPGAGRCRMLEQGRWQRTARARGRRVGGRGGAASAGAADGSLRASRAAHASPRPSSGAIRRATGRGCGSPSRARPSTEASGLSLVSEVVQPGDVQLTGDGAPYVLLAECQTTGGYPRIGTVLPCDLPRRGAGRAGRDAAVPVRYGRRGALPPALPEAGTLAALRRRLRPLVRSAEDIRDLHGLQLISGVTAGDDPA
jgi:5-oxoprolinase (ATP-hydrolysing) subunit C